ncbi:hypothetical protein BAE44_0011013 [Dichanthelium oligosanthes]|uniref:Uncharacterized protein n=1 Tax=Dichanthelium oligosanthes TaxID=888268 RepID=A0A1E5VS61_9POAL|nr:hypothetical protein BAE44_0011013 [Dichanthelium oligosanthes]
MMEYEYPWNTVIIAHLYVTLYFDEESEVTRMYWRTKGDLYSCSYNDFAACIGHGSLDFTRFRIHSKEVLPMRKMKFMYPKNERGNCGKVKGLYTYYSILNRLFRRLLLLEVEIPRISLSMTGTCLLG